MREVIRWLEHLGLGQYANVFTENDVDLRALPHLTDQDLRDLGISLGHRRVLLAAIADLDDQAPPAVESTVSDGHPDKAEAERRQLTIMFCDLVGSTALSGQLDPEDMREVIRAYQSACAGIITRFEGHVANYMGDGVLAYFGYPQAHEDDAERAVRAGLELAEAVAKLMTPTGKHLAARVGIATGQVIVGDIVGEGGAQEEAVVGETPSLAARLQTLAEPNSVVIGPGTRHLLGELFDLADLGARELKGFAEPIQAWRVTGESRMEGRFEARHGAELTPLIGRDEELRFLLSRWRQARDGEGQVVLLSGEPGIGKSRIVESLRAQLADDSYVNLRYFCSPFHVNTALYPILDQLQRAAGFGHDDTVEVKFELLEAVLGQGTAEVGEATLLLAQALGISTAERFPALKMTPQRQKQRTLEALVEQLEGLAAHEPVLMIFEDVHWIDPSTQEFLALVVECLVRLPVLLILTFRPDFQPPWIGHACVTQLSLNRLSWRQGAAVVQRLTSGKPLPAEVLDQILAKTDGVPLFVEELTKTTLELGLLTDAGDHYELAGPLPPLAIPSTLHDSLMARLDRLGPVKEAAQIGAVIGREFSHELLAAVADRAKPELDAALDRLVESELVYRRRKRSGSSYIFKHALVQDTAYHSLLKSKRQQLHARVAEALEASSFEAGAAPELLAHHYTEARLIEPAIKYRQLAGQEAVRRAANIEAIQHFQKALDLIHIQPEGRERNTNELRVLTHLGPALMLVKGWAATEVGTAYERARTLAGLLERSADLVPPLVGMWLFHATRGRFDLADQVTQELFQVAKTTSNRDLLLQSHHAAWPIPMYRGAFVRSNEHIEKGLALYDYEQHKHHAFVYLGHDPAVCAHALGAGVVWALGFPDRAHRHDTDALQIARRLGHAPTLAFALWFLGAAHAARGDKAAALSTAEKLLQLSEEQKLVQTEASALIISGWALALTGQAEDGLERIRTGLENWNRIGARTWLQPFTCLFAESLLHSQRRAEALETLAQALDIGEQTGERWWESRIHQLRAQALLQSGDADSAAVSLQRAIQVARAQDAKSWELRAATSLARHWAEQGKRHDAHDLLAPVYGWFTEGFGTPDLKEAKALLDELA